MRDEEIVKKNWTNFLNALGKNNEGAKEYLEAIEYISGISVEYIDDVDERANINDKLSIIVKFIEDNSNKYYEIGLIKGFKTNEINQNGEWMIDGRDYYYYIADQQIKATVYYARYLNFIAGCEIPDDQKEKIKTRLTEICDKYSVQNDIQEQDVEKLCECLIKKIDNNEIKIDIDNKKEENSNDENPISALNKIRLELLRYLEEFKLSKDISYKLYMMLNNMMHEIRFWGAAYQYLWHWRHYQKTLYRSGPLKEDKEDNSDKEGFTSISEFMKKMFTDCINHMNNPSNIRHSFSENLLIDVYKYLILPKPELNARENDEKILNENGLTITSDSIKNENIVDFGIIKEAKINSVFTKEENGEWKGQSFYDFIQKYDEILQDYAYSVEIYPQCLEGEKNEKGTTKGMRDTLLPLYFASWGINISLNKTKVADDKEVITYGKCYKKEIKIEKDSNIIFKDAESETLFRLELEKNDIINLLLRIYSKKVNNDNVIENIVDKIVKNMEFDKKNKGNFSKFYEGNSDNWIQEYVFNKIDKNPFAINITVERKYLDNIETENVNDTSETIIKEIKECIKNYLSKRYTEICDKNSKVDFIMSTMTDEDFNFWLVSQYNEYNANQEDAEIAMLKYLIFKM